MKILLQITLLSFFALNLSAQTNSTSPSSLIGSKWVHPMHDDCSIVICFISDSEVQYSDCDDHFTFNIAYSVEGEQIKVRMFGENRMVPETQFILIEDNGILRQVAGQQNTLPTQFIRVPNGVCEE